MNLRRILDERLQQAMIKAGAPADAPALVMLSARPEFGDYQANGIMAVAKKLKIKPRDLAENVLAAAELSDLAESIEVAGPGFLNIRLKSEFLSHRLQEAAADEHLGAEKPAIPQTVVVDYSGPNLAKEMHVGHLRSTIIGDALARILEFLGHKVIRQNHVGDWGTQFGMLIAYMQAKGASYGQLADLEVFYKAAKKKFDAEPDFADIARQRVVQLQSGDELALEAWRQFKDVSLKHCEAVYQQLGVTLTRSDVRGESSYNDDLPNIVADLKKAGLLKESQGAQCVFLDEFQGKDGKPLPVIVQ